MKIVQASVGPLVGRLYTAHVTVLDEGVRYEAEGASLTPEWAVEVAAQNAMNKVTSPLLKSCTLTTVVSF